MDRSKPDVRLIHFNDIYHISPQFPNAHIPGGAARFVTLVNEYRNAEQYDCAPELVTVFSGDAFNPSLESSVTKGKHMIDFMNRDHIGVDVAVYGNHDFDFGVEQLKYLKRQCDFPWMIANVLHDGVPIAEGVEYVIKEVSGIKMGFVGLVEKEWLETINSLPQDLLYKPYVNVAMDIAPRLRQEEHCDLVIALTHMREPNDIKLAHAVPEGTFDLILGGHDHFYSHKVANGVDVVCSGTDFRQLSYIEGSLDPNSRRWSWNIVRRDVTKDIAEDEQTQALVESISGYMNRQLDKVIGWTDVSLDATFETVRSRESNLGNFVADILRVWYDADVSLVAGGTLRSDTVYEPGPIRMKDIVLTFPFEDPCVVISVSGKELLDALENGVSKLPALEGRFLQVSGIKYIYCLEKSPRIQSVEVDGMPLNLERMYTCATRGYMMHGKDGFESLMVPPDRQIVDDEQGLLLVQMLRMWFLSMKLFNKWHEQKQSNGFDLSSGVSSWKTKLKNLISDKLHHRDLTVKERDELMREKDMLMEQKVLEIWQTGKVAHGRNRTDSGTHGISPEMEGRIVRVDSHGRAINE
ncbi:Metallo-dependent phosphatase-like protein [Lipomyces orientalis]|uniref:Metallo-dependent phosphatase-like protein n=1 Tax=Lipomyces orientalis TaxID=1233043 RepID=A0ACC3TYP3_9ASCO